MNLVNHIRHCSAALLNRLMRQDPEAAKAAQTVSKPMVYHPAAAEFLRKNGGPDPRIRADATGGSAALVAVMANGESLDEHMGSFTNECLEVRPGDYAAGKFKTKLPMLKSLNDGHADEHLAAHLEAICRELPPETFD